MSKGHIKHMSTEPVEGMPPATPEDDDGHEEGIHPFQAVMNELTIICMHNKPVTHLREVIREGFPTDKETAGEFMAQLDRLKSAAEVAASLGRDSFFAITNR